METGDPNGSKATNTFQAKHSFNMVSIKGTAFISLIPFLFYFNLVTIKIQIHSQDILQVFVHDVFDSTNSK